MSSGDPAVPPARRPVPRPRGHGRGGLVMELTVLGCSGSYGGPDDACSGYLVRSGDTAIWMDCGAGTLGHLQRHLEVEDLTAVVVTHAHPDHCVDLYGLHVLAKWGLERSEIPVYAGRSRRSSRHPRRRRLGRHGSPGAGSKSRRRRRSGPHGPLQFSRTDHPLPTYAVDITADGRRLVYTADTSLTDRSVSAFAPGADLVLSEATYLHDDKPAPIHLSAKEAGMAAREARARRLMLTHLWPQCCRAGRRARARRRRSGSRSSCAAPRHRINGDPMGPGRPRRTRRAAHGGVHPRLHRVRRRVGPRRVRPHPGPVHRVGRGASPTVAARQGAGLGHRRVFDAPGSTSERAEREAARRAVSGVARRRSSG